MASELVFYTNPQSRGRIVRWMLEEVGAPYRAELVAFGPPMKGPDYLAVNPLGKVPAIQHGGTIVTETAAICAYLADAFPEAGLAPPLGERGAYYRWLFFAAGPLEAAIINKALGVEVPKERRGMVGYGAFDVMLDTVEKAVAKGGYIAADRFTAADLYLGSQIGFGIQFGTIEKRQAFADYWARVSDREACRRAVKLDDDAAAAAAAKH